MTRFCKIDYTYLLTYVLPYHVQIGFSTLDRDLASSAGLKALLTGEAFRKALGQELYDAGFNFVFSAAVTTV